MSVLMILFLVIFFFQAEDGIRDVAVTGVQTCALPIYHVSPNGRVMEVLSEHLCHGWLEGYLLTGRHGLFATYESFAMVSASMTVQHAKWLEEGIKLAWRKSIASLNIPLTSTCWRNDHNGFSP